MIDQAVHHALLLPRHAILLLLRVLLLLSKSIQVVGAICVESVAPLYLLSRS